MLVIVLAFGAAALIFVIKVPQLQARHVPPKERFEAENKARATLLQGLSGLGGVFFFVTAYLAWRNLRVSEDKQVTDRFVKATEMLADKERSAVRLGGIYSLERIARDSPIDHGTVMQVLASFIQEQSGYPADQKVRPFVNRIVRPPSSELSEDIRLPRISRDIQAALTVIGRRTIENDLTKIISFVETNLTQANFSDANFSNVEFLDVYLEGAFFSDANFTKAVLSNCQLSGVYFINTSLEGVNFIFSDLRCAHFREAKLKDTCFRSTNLQGADFRTAIGLKPKQVIEAKNWEKALYNPSFEKKLKPYREEYAKKAAEEEELSRQLSIHVRAFIKEELMLPFELQQHWGVLNSIIKIFNGH